LTKDHDLYLALKGTKDSKSGEKILLGGLIKDVTKNSLEFELANYQGKELEQKQVLALIGTWQVDKNNQLIFKVSKEKSRHDILTFNNAWIINKHHRIFYKYEKASLFYKKKEIHAFVFTGYWNITKDNRLYYELEKDNNAGLKFKLGTAFFEKNRIKYKFTIGKGSKEQEIIIRGQWKISKDLGLTFEVDYGENEIKPISFGGQWDLSDDTTLNIKFKKGLEAKMIKFNLQSTIFKLYCYLYEK